MKKRIHIFKSFEEQELFHLKKMANRSPNENFRILKLMQDFFFKIDPTVKRKIVILKSTIE